MSAPKALKCVVIGDACVGKTCMVARIAGRKPNLENYQPTIVENTVVPVVYKGQQCSLEVCDTAGQEDYAFLRPSAYMSTDAFLVCFCLVDQTSFENLESVWLPELNKHQSTAKVILIGTKLDLYTPDGSRAVAKAQIDALCSKYGFQYVQCSSVNKVGIQDVVDRTLQVLHGETDADKKGKRRSSKRLKLDKCGIL